MRQSEFPEWARKIKLQYKGTQLRKVGNHIYLYAVSSKRVPDRPYPVLSQSYLGIVTENGLIEAQSFLFNPLETAALPLSALPAFSPDSFSPEEWKTIRSICMIQNGDSWFFPKLTDEQTRILRNRNLISPLGALVQ